MAAALPERSISLRPATRELLLDGKPADVGARAFDLLVALAERRDRVVGKNEILDVVWPNLVVEENNVEVHISALRRVLGRTAIATIPGRGYRLTAAVAVAGDGSSAQRVEPAKPATTSTALRTNLPDTLSPLIGREDELAALHALVAEQPLVTLLGAGGVGKTRLAQAVLDARRGRYAQGVCWVELAPVNDAPALPLAIAAALGVQLGSGDALSGLGTVLRPLELLVALDNAEHIVQHVAHVVARLRADAPGVRIMVTSQAPLRIEGEHVYRVGGLRVPESDASVTAGDVSAYGAIALFVARARAADRSFTLDDANASQVVAICAALDGMALAIELAAARLPMLGLAGLLSRLDERLRLLGGGQRTAPKRLQTLAAALEWSHDLLAQREQMAFRRMAVFRGSASLDAIREVVASDGLDEWDVVDALAELVDRSLVSVLTGDDPEPRYRLLDTPLAFAREKVLAAGEWDALRTRHAAYLRKHFDALDDERLAGVRPVNEIQRWQRLDLDNARAALAWAVEHDHEAALALAATMSFAMDLPMYRDAAGVWDMVDSLFESPMLTSIPALVSGRAAARCAYHWQNTRSEHAVARARQAAELLRAAGSSKELYMALATLAIATSRGDTPTVAAQAVRELAAFEDPSWPGAVRLVSAQANFHVASASGEYAKARQWAARWLLLARQAGANTDAAENNLIDNAIADGHPEEAVREGTPLLAEVLRTRRMNHAAYVSINVVAAYLLMDDTEEARNVAREGWRLAPMFDLQGPWAAYFAVLAALEGRTRTACLMLGCSDERYEAQALRRYGNEARAVDRAAGLVAGKLPAEEIARLRREGRELDDAIAMRLAFATSDEIAGP